jgi:hypothetical protein
LANNRKVPLRLESDPYLVAQHFAGTAAFTSSKRTAILGSFEVEVAAPVVVTRFPIASYANVVVPCR